MRFWWKNNSGKGIHWRSWDLLTRIKNEGGLGFKDLETQNQAVLANQAWRITQNPNALWVRVLKGIYFITQDFLLTPKKRNASWVWASILHGRELLVKQGRRLIGNGEKVDVWDHRWVSSGEKLIPEQGQQSMKVKNLMIESRKVWNVGKIRQTLTSTDLGKVKQTLFSWEEGPDELIWPFCNSGLYAVKSGYREAQKLKSPPDLLASSSNRDQTFLWNTIWGANLPSKIKTFLWKVANNDLPVKAEPSQERLLPGGHLSDLWIRK